jgi:hypothetical protein
MAWSLVTVTPPASEPLSLDEAKQHLRVTADDDDDYIQECISVGRQILEKESGRAFLPTVFRMQMDSFPDLPNATLKFFIPTYSVESYLARAISLMSGPIHLPRSPVSAVTAITYLDPSGVLQTLPVFDGVYPPDQPYCYILDTDSEPARIAPGSNRPWPVTLAQQSAVSITFTAGYASKSLLPLNLKQAMKLLVSHYYENREPFSEKIMMPLGRSVDALLWLDRVYEIP